LKQAQWVWNERYDTFYLGLGFRRCQTNPNTYSLKIKIFFNGQAIFGGTIKTSKKINLSIILEASTHLAKSSVSFIRVAHAHDWINSAIILLLH
jgi:hypothetical protein